jgi:hypothetical protein
MDSSHVHRIPRERSQRIARKFYTMDARAAPEANHAEFVTAPYICAMARLATTLNAMSLRSATAFADRPAPEPNVRARARIAHVRACRLRFFDAGAIDRHGMGSAARDAAVARTGGRPMGYDELVNELRTLLRTAIKARYRGDLHAHKVRAQAYADGYMQALQDAGLIGRDELLQIVAEARVDVAGEPIEERIAAAG